MRMRRKKNLEERIADCGELLLDLKPSVLDCRQVEPDAKPLDFSELFGNRPVELEIGCGKGGYTCACAERSPDIGILAVEASRNVIVAGCEQAKQMGLKNVRFLNIGAEYLDRYIPHGSIERIYLNFSCPYPKSGQACRRLTYPRYLDIYKKLLKPGGSIWQKTDNIGLFEYSLEQYSKSGFILQGISLDLHSEKERFAAEQSKTLIETEYEHKFVSRGMVIYRAEAVYRQ